MHKLPRAFFSHKFGILRPALPACELDVIAAMLMLIDGDKNHAAWWCLPSLNPSMLAHAEPG